MFLFVTIFYLKKTLATNPKQKGQELFFNCHKITTSKWDGLNGMNSPR